MPGVILALLEHPESARATLDAAHALGTLMHAARINVLAIRMPPQATIVASEEVLTRHHAEKIRAEEQSRIAALQTIYESWAPTARATDRVVAWADEEGRIDTILGARGGGADILVVRRPLPHAPLADRQALHAALFTANRPVLVIPPGPAKPFGTRIAIAWRDDQRAALAALTALRFLPPTAEIHLLAGIRPGATPPILPPMFAEHGFAATLHLLPITTPPFGATLRTACQTLAADLLVMGAYTHRPWREVLLGGVTRHILTHAELPVLMRH
jgi:hypothetical protein